MQITTFNFPDTFTFDGNTSMLSGYKAVNKALELSIKTYKGELAGDPYFGSNFNLYQYEQNTDVLRDQIVDDMLSLISTYDTRIDMNDTDITATANEASVKIDCNYYLKSEDSMFGISILM